jgi:hypothetical protein
MLQFKEKSGEAFFKVITVKTQWSQLDIKLNSLQLDSNTKQNGVFNPENLVSILLADSAGAEKGKRGKQSIEISKLLFKQ